MPLEIAAFCSLSAIRALLSHAVDRIELCTDSSVGGTTPSLHSFQAVSQHPTCTTEYGCIPIHVMIRPRGADFIYDDEEFESMMSQIKVFDEAGADGFVFGVLRYKSVHGSEKELEIDIERCKILLSAANGKPCTFHRAFDALPPEIMLSQLEILIELGFKYVLTSGDGATALEGQEMLRRLVERARLRIGVIVGGGVRSTNVQELEKAIYGGEGDRQKTGWWHSSAVVDDSQMASRQEVLALSEALG